ncbi:MAG: hypothetical protein Q9174_005884 [Haloplaca sp. 1 TL-2023]
MAANSIDTFVVIYHDPETSGNRRDKNRASPDISYHQLINEDGLRTLSAHENGNDNVEGFLYVPDLPDDSPCTNDTLQYIPPNVARRDDFPDIERLFIALAPWTTPECVQSFLDAAQDIRAFIFYLPGNHTERPPEADDPQWRLDNGEGWKSDHRYPVYAVSGFSGADIMTQLSLYNGAISDVPDAVALQENFGQAYNARMYAMVGLQNTTSLPSLWAFLLIVLGVVLSMIGITSGVMHLYQRRRRNRLRRRIVNGQVDLERLGIKRLTVPQDAINMLPQFVYSPSEKDLLDRPRDHVTALSDFPIKESDTDTTASDNAAQPPSSVPMQKSISPPMDQPVQTAPVEQHRSREAGSSSSEPGHYIQPTCPVCLDDFVPHSTTVRSLPCHHIYHPECIDPFLLRNSSLCPVCKSKVLPKGYCPATITNAMVRRERQQRRNRDRVLRVRGPEAAAQIPVASLEEPRQNRMSAMQGRFHRPFGRQSRAGSTVNPDHAAISPSDGVEMRNMNGDTTAPSTSQPAEPAAAAPSSDTPAADTPPLNTETLQPEQPQQQQQQQHQEQQASPTPSPNPAAAERSERARRRISLFMRDQQQQPTAEEEEQQRVARLPRCEIPVSKVFSAEHAANHNTKYRAQSSQQSLS